jgi:hypothetical protein
MENHHVQWENPLFLWPFSIAMLNYQRVTPNPVPSKSAMERAKRHLPAPPKQPLRNETSGETLAPQKPDG